MSGNDLIRCSLGVSYALLVFFVVRLIFFAPAPTNTRQAKFALVQAVHKATCCLGVDSCFAVFGVRSFCFAEN